MMQLKKTECGWEMQIYWTNTEKRSMNTCEKNNMKILDKKKLINIQIKINARSNPWERRKQIEGYTDSKKPKILEDVVYNVKVT